MDFTGKVAIVTGSSSGIGAATAKRFAAHGALLTIIGRNEANLMEVAKACESKGNKPLCLILDLTAEKSCEELVAKTIEKYGRIDILVNCAGKAGISSLFDNSMEVFDELVALNLRVPYKLTQLCLPHLQNTQGNVVNVFGAPMTVRPGFLPFAMIKDALDRFNKTGALELALVGVRMNAVRPGITRTNFLSNLNISENCMDSTYKLLADVVPNKVIIEPDEIATMIVFAASNACPNMIATNLTVDGGASSS